jgi:creatinine amidohydrolase
VRSRLLGERRFPEASILGRAVILPTGACEAHGPHLPVDTDVRIAVAMAERAAERVDGRVLPPLTYGVARFARNFPGTISISPEVMVATVTEILVAAHAAGASALGLANAHLEPANIDALFAAARRVKELTGVDVAFPNVGSRRSSERLARAGCAVDGHSGRYETSLVLAISPRLVHGHAKLPAVEADLGAGIAAGATSFEEAGGPLAYFGRPAEGSGELGERLLDELGAMLAEGLGG